METCGDQARTERIALEIQEGILSIDDLKAARQIADLSQFHVSRLTGISRTRLSLAENGDVQLKPEELALIQGVLRKHLAMRAREIGSLLSQEHAVTVLIPNGNAALSGGGENGKTSCERP